MKTVFITGASSGIGLATVHYFAKQGWNVAATMRSPEKSSPELKGLDRVKLYRLDVCDEKSIEDSIKAAMNDFGGIDAIVNNAGYPLVGAFETTSSDQIQREMDTNFFGALNVIRAILPYYRQKGAGHIINVSTIGGRLAFPAYSLYHGSKWALEGFSESLQYELRPFNIKVKLVEPGPVKTAFYDRSMVFSKRGDLKDYDAFVDAVNTSYQISAARAPEPASVAKTIYKAANDQSFKLRYISGFLGRMLLFFKWLLPFALFSKMMLMSSLRK